MASNEQRFSIILLGKQHKRAAFSCGQQALDDYIHRQAGQEGRKRVAVTYVLAQANDPETICGYYTLSAYTLELAELPETLAKGLPRYPLIGATLLGRLAVDQCFRAKKLGKVLLFDALKRSLEQSQYIGSMAVVVDALDEDAKRFYERYGFISLPEQPLKLLIPMKTIALL